MKSGEKILNKNNIERLIIFHNAIKAGGYPNVPKLRSIYKEKIGIPVGEATVHRDINMLRTRFGAPLEYDYTAKGYYYMDDNWDFALNSISPEDMFYLAAAKTMISGFKNTPIYDEISSVIDFISNTQGEVSPEEGGGQNFGGADLLDRIAIPPKPIVRMDEDIWKAVVAGLRRNVILEFDYKGRWNSEITHRRVRPYQVLLDDGVYFLFGYAEEREAERLFCLNRMRNVVVTGDSFELPENYDFTARCSGGKFGAFMESDVQEYEIIFYDDARQYVKECVWAEDQVIEDDEERGITTIKFSSAQSYKVLEWVLAQGCNARPVGPEEFVNRWKGEIIRMVRNAGLREFDFKGWEG